MLHLGKNGWLVTAALTALLVLSWSASALPALPPAPSGPAVPLAPDVPIPDPAVPAKVVTAVEHAKQVAGLGPKQQPADKPTEPANNPGQSQPNQPPPNQPPSEPKPAPGEPQRDFLLSRVAGTSGTAQDAIQETRDSLPTDFLGTVGGAANDAQNRAGELQRKVSAPVSLGDASARPQSTQAKVAEPSGLAYPILAGSLLAVGATGATFVGFWLAGSSGTVGAGGAAKVAGKDLRRLLPYASPLFTRFERDTVLGHPRREALYALILQQPGISLQALGEGSGLSRTAALHHLRLMEQSHVVVSKRMGRSRHYFENGGRYGRDQKDAYAVLQNDRSKEVADFIRHHPGAMQKSLCEALGIQPSIAHWHVRRLQQAQLIESVRQGRTVNYFPARGLLEVAPIPAATMTAMGPGASIPA